MTAKRTNKTTKAVAPANQRNKDIIDLIKHDPLFLEVLTELGKNAELTEEQKIDSSMLEFANSLHKLPACLKTTAKFNAQWENLLKWHEEKEKAWLTKNTSLQKSSHRLIKRAWALLNHERNAYEYLSKKPDASLHTIPVVLVNWYGTWDLSPSLKATLIDHPTYRALAKNLPPPEPRDSLIGIIQWAKSRFDSTDSNEQTLAQLSERIDSILQLGRRGHLKNTEWLKKAAASDQFWILLRTVFDLGMQYSVWQIYQDGTVEKASRKGLIMAEKGIDSWSRFIAEALVNHYQQHGVILTASKLRKLLGSELPTNQDEALRFRNPECQYLPPITWPQFQERVKETKVRLSKTGAFG